MKFELVKTNGYNMAVVIEGETVYYHDETTEFPDVNEEKAVKDFLIMLSKEADYNSWDTMTVEEYESMFDYNNCERAEVVAELTSKVL